MTQPPLRRLRLRLTAWYLATFCAILGSLGVGLLITIRHQIARELDNSLVEAAAHLRQAAQIRENEASLAHGAVVDAVEELRIPDRRLYLLRYDGTPVIPDSVSGWVRATARVAATAGSLDTIYPEFGEESLRGHAEAFTLLSGERMVAIVVADNVVLNDRYAALIAAFSGAALAALLLSAAGGWFLVRKSTAPVERSFEHMRRFMGDAAHELRTPLTILRTRAEVALQQPRSPEAYVEALEGIEEECQRLGRIVDNLLTLARADAGERPIERNQVFLDDVVLDAARDAHLIAQKSGVSLDVGEFAEAEVSGDATLLRQLAMILLDNAIKFTPPGGHVQVRVGVMQGAPALVVQDSGAGIATEHLPHIFERFYRGDRGRENGANGRSGAGLGMAIARWIADEHKADVAVESAVEKGTSVTVRFPKIPG